MKYLRLLIIAAVTLAAGLAVRQWAYTPIYVATDSMRPTLNKGHHLILDRLVYRFREPRRGEIISFNPPDGADYGMVKRVIAVAGDTVELREKKVYLDGEPQYEMYAHYERPDELLQGDNLGPLTVPERHLFVLGDNRDESYDSTSWKHPDTGEPLYFLPLSAVNGKVRGAY